MLPSELPAYLAAIADRAAAAAVPAVDAMAGAYRDRVAGVTLLRYSHPPETWTDSPPGQPPARVTGELAASVLAEPAMGGGGIAWASVAPHTIYAEIQETGGTIHAHERVRGGWTGQFQGKGVRGLGQHTMRFTVGGRAYYPMEVTLPARPYMRPTTEEMLASGALRDEAVEAFLAAVWG